MGTMILIRYLCFPHKNSHGMIRFLSLISPLIEGFSFHSLSLKVLNIRLLIFSPSELCPVFCPERCPHASQWWVAEDSSRKSGQQGFYQVLCATEIPEPDGGEAGQNLQHLHRPAGQRNQGREITSSFFKFVMMLQLSVFLSCVAFLPHTLNPNN